MSFAVARHLYGRWLPLKTTVAQLAKEIGSPTANASRVRQRACVTMANCNRRYARKHVARRRRKTIVVRCAVAQLAIDVVSPTANASRVRQCADMNVPGGDGIDTG